MDQNLLKSTIESIEEFYNLLYQDNTGEAYGKLAKTVGNLDQVIVQIEDDQIQEELKKHLLEALEAMEDGDHILLADIFQYEINERLQKYQEN